MIKEKRNRTSMPNNKKRGDLVVPSTATILTAEPAIMMHTKRAGYLLSSAPNDSKNAYDYSDTLDEKPVLIAKSNRQNGIGITSTIPPDTEVLARPINAANTVYEVATFKRVGAKDPAIPESGNEIEIINKGWMFACDLKKGRESFKPFTGDIFEEIHGRAHEPIPQTVHQAWMGNCFLLSAIIALLRAPNGIDFLKEIMHQEDDGTTIVKLYHPKTLQPCYIRVSNSYHCRDNEPTISHEQPWVHILEKAYAVLAYNADEKPEFASFLSMYGQGGDATVAFKILTGNPAHKNVIMNEELIQNQPLHPSSILLALQLLELKSPAEQEHFLHDHAALFNAFDGNLDLFLQWGHFLLFLKNKGNPEYFKLLMPDAAYTDLKQIDESIKTLSSIMDDEKKPVFPEGMQHILKKCSEPRIGPNDRIFYPVSKRGEYTEYQYRLFDELQTAIAQQKILTASSQSQFEDKAPPGLVNKHAYAILGVFESETHGKKSLTVRLQNPWGKKGRTYDLRGNPVECDHPVFDLDMTDFTRYFSSFSVGCVGAFQPFKSAKETTYENLVLKSLQYEKELSQSIETFVKHKKLELYQRYSMDRLNLNQESKPIIAGGFDIADFINSQDEESVSLKNNSRLQLTIQKYRVMKEANAALTELKPIPMRINHYAAVIKKNQPLLETEKDPWYFSVLKALAICAATFIGYNDYRTHQFFYRKTSTTCKAFLTNIDPMLKLFKN